MNNLTFEQLKPALHKWAHHFQNEKYEHWELINAVWVMGSVQKLHINLASRRIRFDMIEYMRKEENFKRRKRDEANGVFVPKVASLNFLVAEDVEFINTIEGHKGPCRSDTEDYFNWAVKGFNRREKLVVKLYFIDGLNLAEIGKTAGYTESWACVVLKKVLGKIRHKLLLDNPELKDVGPCLSHRGTGERNRELQRFYNRAYYKANRARILAGNRRRRKAG